MAVADRPQSTTLRVPLQAYLASDHITPATSKTIAVTISKNGAAYGNPSAGATNATEISSGSYYVDLSTTDTGTLGPLFVRGAVATVDDVIAIYNVVKATNGGWTALPDTAVTTNGSLLTFGTGTAQISGDVYSKLVVNTGTLQTGGTNGATLDAGASSVPGAYAGMTLVFLSGAGAGQARSIGTYNSSTKIANFNPLTTDVDNTTTYAILSVTDETWADAFNTLEASINAVRTTTDKFRFGTTNQVDANFINGNVALTESYAANGAAPTAVQLLYALHQDRMSFAISGTSKTVRKLNNSTTAFVETLDSATAPTALSRT